MARRPLAKHSVARNWSDGVRYAGKSSKCTKRSEVRAAAAAAAKARERERATERGMRGRGGGGQPAPCTAGAAGRFPQKIRPAVFLKNAINSEFSLLRV